MFCSADPRHCEEPKATKQSRNRKLLLDCVASLAMTAGRNEPWFAIEWNGGQHAPVARIVKDDARSASPPQAVLCILDEARRPGAIVGRSTHGAVRHVA